MQSPRLPNILYINSHDTGRYIQPYGHPMETPSLQRLAEEGVLFRRAFSAAPTCSPSRAALVLGQLPHSTGMFGLGHRGFLPHDHGQHLAHTLQKAGYQTVVDSQMPGNHLGVRTGADAPSSGEQCGYMRKLQVADEFDNQPILEFFQEPHDQPFFLSISYARTHRRGRGFSVERDPKDDPRYICPPAPLADDPVVRADWAHFRSDTRSLDTAIGELLDGLDAAGLREQTLVIATTDHGPPFPGMKCELNVHGTGVFLLLRGPGGFTGGKVVDALVSHLEIYPTICDLIGLERPDFLQGTSLLPLIRGEVESVRDAMISEVTFHAGYEPKRLYREARWVYGRRFGERRQPVLVNVDASPSKDRWLADGYAERELDQEVLYDTFYDPMEMNNLAYHPAYQKMRCVMADKLEQAMRKNGDPLLDGDIPLPEGAWVNGPDEIEPGPRPSA